MSNPANQALRRSAGCPSRAPHLPRKFGLGALPLPLPPLRFQVDRAWDVAPGGQDFYNAEVALIALSSGCGTVEKALEESCQVPTVSALDLQADPFSPVAVPGSGNTPFEDYAFCDANQPHLTITPALSKWLLSALGAPCAAEKEMSDA